MGDDDDVRRLHAELERLAAEVAELRKRLDDQDAAMDKAISGGPEEKRPPWKLLCGGADVAAAGAALVQRAALLAVTTCTAELSKGPARAARCGAARAGRFLPPLRIGDRRGRESCGLPRARRRHHLGIPGGREKS